MMAGIVMNRRTFLAAAAASAVAAETRRPNILWISCEDSSPHYGCYGDTRAITPNVDRLAREGVRYTRAYSVAGVCAPSRSAIITSVYPTSLGSQYMRCSVALPEHIKCFPTYLRNAGYYCTNNVKTDYNFPVPADAWDENSRSAHWKNRKPGQPFFAVFNIEATHESQCRKRGVEYDQMIRQLKPEHRQDPTKLTMPPYYPDTLESRRDWAQMYELITAMDMQLGERLKELEEAGLMEDTIVFFWGDHGDGLPRAKRWLYESSTHVPLVIRTPEKFRSDSKARTPGSVESRLVSLLDLGPTVLNLAGVALPKHMDGVAFLGSNAPPPREYIFGLRDRMDERYDTVRMVRDRRYRYIRNYTPHLPYAQHTAYMEQGNIMKELRAAQRDGRLPEAARQYMSETKPIEELYDVDADPHELRNLAGSAAHRKTLLRLRAAHQRWVIDTRDVGLIPEPDLEERSAKAGTRYQVLRQADSEKLLRELLTLVDAVNRDVNPELIRKALTHPDPAMRYWAVVGSGKTAAAAKSTQDLLVRASSDDAPAVRIAALGALALHLGDKGAMAKLASELKSGNSFARLHAAQALDGLGHRAAPARQALTEAAADPAEYVKRVAEHALATLSGG
ncbi:MAG TPA: sulfatase-like hydrolase/transferase [Bryobacteraceae bacterium]|nr:sulfatase-like hydrolase/transferase [Bryobacteraceae bacterium]